MWIYRIKPGRLSQGDRFVSIGYSGMGASRDDPGAIHVRGQGPIPVGVYVIGPEREITETHGPVVLPLTPIAYVETFGRSNFLIHGDSVSHPGSASHGCIILPRPIREEISSSRDRLLVVLSGNPELTAPPPS